MLLKELNMKLLGKWKVPRGGFRGGFAGGQQQGIRLSHSGMSDEILDSEAYRD
jgi:hypothetical protein